MNESQEPTPLEAPKPRRKTKRKVTTKKKSAPKKTAPKARSAERTTPAPKRKVVLLNTLGQMLEISILNENGVHTQLRLASQGKSDAVIEDRITPYTQRLISRGYLRVVNP
jgi:hypothetical protein